MSEEAIAIVSGKPWNKVPKDLFIPPEALKVVLESFEGPLALLLYLIKKDNIDILNIPIVSVADQYLQYIELMEDLEIDIAADYLLMAATLAELKSRELVPKPAIVADLEGDEPDPKHLLIQKLQLYQACKEAADVLDCLPQLNRDHCLLEPIVSNIELPTLLPTVNVFDLQKALKGLLGKSKLTTKHIVKKDEIDIKLVNAIMLEKIDHLDRAVNFLDIVVVNYGLLGVVLSFLVILQFAAQGLITIVQTEIDSIIYIQKLG